MKMWRTENEWQRYANCGNSIDHTLPPVRTDPEEEGLPVANRDRVVHLCAGCRVRPECVRWAVQPGKDAPIDVWIAGRYIPVNKRQARKVRQQLAESLEEEYFVRGEDI